MTVTECIPLFDFLCHHLLKKKKQNSNKILIRLNTTHSIIIPTNCYRMCFKMIQNNKIIANFVTARNIEWNLLQTYNINHIV